MDLLESSVSSPLPSNAAAAAVRGYFEWPAQHRAVDFIPSADDDVDLRTFLFDLRAKGADLVALEEQGSALEQSYQWVQAKGFIAHNPFLVEIERLVPDHGTAGSDSAI
jgi:hypothetical protein